MVGRVLIWPQFLPIVAQLNQISTKSTSTTWFTNEMQSMLLQGKRMYDSDNVCFYSRFLCPYVICQKFSVNVTFNLHITYYMLPRFISAT